MEMCFFMSFFSTCYIILLSICESLPSDSKGRKNHHAAAPGSSRVWMRISLPRCQWKIKAFQKGSDTKNRSGGDCYWEGGSISTCSCFFLVLRWYETSGGVEEGFLCVYIDGIIDGATWQTKFRPFEFHVGYCYC